MRLAETLRRWRRVGVGRLAGGSPRAAAEEAYREVDEAADQQQLEEHAEHARAAAEAAAEHHAEQAGTQHAAHQSAQEGMALHEAALRGRLRGIGGCARTSRLRRRGAAFYRRRCGRGFGRRRRGVRLGATAAGTGAAADAGVGDGRSDNEKGRGKREPTRRLHDFSHPLVGHCQRSQCEVDSRTVQGGIPGFRSRFPAAPV